MSTVVQNLYPSLISTGATAQNSVKTSAKTMVNADIIFRIVGDIQILSLVSECYTANDATASTVQYNFTNTTTATSQTLSNASTTLASKGIGSAMALAAASTLAEAVTLSANISGALVNTASRGVRLTTGTINLVVGTGSTTGTWKHYLVYQPIEAGAYAYAGQ